MNEQEWTYYSGLGKIGWGMLIFASGFYGFLYVLVVVYSLSMRNAFYIGGTTTIILIILNVIIMRRLKRYGLIETKEKPNSRK